MFIPVIFVLTFLFYFFLFFMFVCLFICFFLVENFYVYFLEFNNCVCKFDKNKNKNLLKKKKKKEIRSQRLTLSPYIWN